MDEARTGAAVLPAARVKVSADSVRVGPARPVATGPGPQVSVVREGGAIRVIEVTCTCGECVRIRCDYE